MEKKSLFIAPNSHQNQTFCLLLIKVFGRYSLGKKKQHRNELTLEQAQLSTAVSPVPLPAAWLPRIPWIGPTWEVGGTLATPLLLTEEGVEGFRHRFSDFSLQSDGDKHEETQPAYNTTTKKSVSE